MAWLDQRTAPGRLELLRAFVNTRDIARGGDALDTRAGAARWFAEQGLLGADAVTDRDLRRVLAVREAFRELLAGHTSGGAAPAALATVNRIPTRAELTPCLTEAGSLNLTASATGIDGALGGLAVIMFEAVAAGTWPRLKACSSCGWAFYDASRNMRSRWCDMAVCGNRAKQRAFQARH